MLEILEDVKGENGHLRGNKKIKSCYVRDAILPKVNKNGLHSDIRFTTTVKRLSVLQTAVISIETVTCKIEVEIMAYNFK